MSGGDRSRGPPPTAPDATATRPARPRPRARRRRRRSAPPAARILPSARSDRYSPARQREAGHRSRGRGNKRWRVDGGMQAGRPQQAGRGAPPGIDRRVSLAPRERPGRGRGDRAHAGGRARGRTLHRDGDGRSIDLSVGPPRLPGARPRALVSVAARRAQPLTAATLLVLGKGLTWPCRSRAQAGAPSGSGTDDGEPGACSFRKAESPDNNA
jgi:hypothetical protein